MISSKIKRGDKIARSGNSKNLYFYSDQDKKNVSSSRKPSNARIEREVNLSGSGLKILSIVSSVFSKIFSVGFLKSKKFQFFVLPLLIVGLIGAYAFYSFFYSWTALFTLNLEYKYSDVSQTKEIPINSATNLQFVDLTQESSLSNTIETTGEQIVGEKSKGKIQIYNLTSDVRTIPAGTVLTCVSVTCNKLTYVTQFQLNLGGAASEAVDVIASDIGENYNATSGNRFAVSGFNSDTEVFGSTILPLSGGTPKKTVKVVAAADITNGETAAAESLQSTLLTTIKNTSANNDKFILDSTYTFEKTSVSSDLKEGETGSRVTVTVSGKGNVRSVPKNQFETYVEAFKAEITPEGYTLDMGRNTPQISLDTTDPNSPKIMIKVVGTLRVEFDLAKIRDSLAGVKYSKVDEIVKQIPNTSGHSKDFNNKILPEFFWKVPKNKDKILINVISVK